MFGYVRPAMGRLSPEDQQRYQALYCGLCHRLGERCGFLSRMTLNYDFTFLAALLSADDACCPRRCPVSPLQKRPAVSGSEALDLAADCSVILTYYKVLDEVADGRFTRRQFCRLGGGLLRKAYRACARRRPAFDEAVRREMGRLHRLEEEQCPIMDESADTFARLLESIALEIAHPVERRILAQFLYHLGRWIYLVDALDDLKKDRQEGNYNPIALRFGLADGVLTEEARKSVSTTLDASIRQMAAAYELWTFGPWSALIQSTVYEGLYHVGHAVLEGTFHASDWREYFRGKKEQL